MKQQMLAGCISFCETQVQLLSDVLGEGQSKKQLTKQKTNTKGTGVPGQV